MNLLEKKVEEAVKNTAQRDGYTNLSINKIVLSVGVLGFVDLEYDWDVHENGDIVHMDTTWRVGITGDSVGLII